MTNESHDIPVPDSVKKKGSVDFNPEISIIYVPEPSEYGDDISIKNSRVWETDRQQWDKSRDFFVALISLTVGLGNIYRFPFAVYKHGGGAFLIPYLLILIFVGRPMYLMELALGQFSSLGQVKVWRIAPICKGVGYGSMIATITTVTYYASTMAVLLLYFFLSFGNGLPWSKCEPSWVEPMEPFRKWHRANTTARLSCNASDPSVAFEVNTGDMSEISLAQLYFENHIMKQRDHIRDGLGLPDWKLALCLLLGWILIWATLLKGVRVSGKVAYVTAIFPYFLLFILFIRAVSLPNAWEGIRFFLMPDWKKMLEADVWFAAASQCLFSLSAGFGPLVMLSSFNRFDRNIYKDAWVVSSLDVFTSLLGGMAVFAFLGNMAGQLDVSIDRALIAENDFALIVFAQGVSTFKVAPQLFSLIFYLMLVLLSGGTIVAYVGAIITVVTDEFPKVSKFYIATGICLLGCMLGLIYVTPGGSVMVRLADFFGVKIVILVMVFVEVVGVAWIYGIDNFLKDFEFMLDIKLGWYWKFCWSYFIPVSLAAILTYACIAGAGVPGYKGDYFSQTTLFFGWLFSTMAVSAIPICSFHAIKSIPSGSFFERLKKASTPRDDWGPRRVDIRQDWLRFKQKMT